CEVDVQERTYDPAANGSAWPEGVSLLGANMAVRVAEAARVGGLDECLGPGTAFGGGEEHDFAFRLMGLGVRMRSTPKSIVRHTYGARYGWRAVYAVKRSRLRGDGAVAAKGPLRSAPGGGLSVRDTLWEYLRAQLASVRIRGLPNACFRLFHLGMSYRECLRGYQLSLAQAGEAMTGVLVPRTDDAPRSATGPARRAIT